MRTLIVLRPQPGAAATVKRARSLGLTAESIPLFVIEPVEWVAPDPAEFDGLLITSGNAIRMAGAALDTLRRLPVVAVGEASAAAAEQAGLNVEQIGDRGVDGLLRKLLDGRRLLHLCGKDHHLPSGHRHSIRHLPVYRSVAVPVTGLAERLEDTVAALHSPRAAQRLAELVDRPSRARIAIAAISDRALASAGQGWRQAKASAQPGDDALLALALSLCEE